MRAFLPLVLLVGAFAGSIPAAAQPALRTASGHLDLSGVWSNASLTWLERPATLKGPTLSEAEAKAQAEADKEAGKAKLAALGLSDAEIAALVG